MLYKLALGLFATAVVGETAGAAPPRRLYTPNPLGNSYRTDLGYGSSFVIVNYNLQAATGKSWTDEEGNPIDLKDFKKKDLISLDKTVMKQLLKYKKKMKKIKKKCERRRDLSALTKAQGIVAAAEGEGISKKKGKKKKYKKMTKDELIDLVGESAMDVEKAKKKLKKMKKKCGK